MPLSKPWRWVLPSLLLWAAPALATQTGANDTKLFDLERFEAGIIDGPSTDGTLELDITLASGTDIAAQLPAIRASLLFSIMEFARLEAMPHRVINTPLLHRQLRMALVKHHPEITGLYLTHIRIR